MSKNAIIVEGAREHNLKNVTVSVPRNRLTVVTGLSGSGKSSLAFDTLYAEGQRRYVESLSAYARQFLDQMQKPDVDHIEGLSPAIAIEQRGFSSNPRSVVATSTEVHDYLRILYANLGQPHCPGCGGRVTAQTAEQIVDSLTTLPARTRVVLLAPVVRNRRGKHEDVVEFARKQGFLRLRVNGELYELDEMPALSARKSYDIEIVVDRLIITSRVGSRLTDSVELALLHGSGSMMTLHEEKKGQWVTGRYSEKLSCADCNIAFETLLPRSFSFNSPFGACERCSGLGTELVLDPELVIPDTELSIDKGAVRPWRQGGRRLIMYYNRQLKGVSAHYGFDLKTPWGSLPESLRQILLNGSGDEELEFGYWRGRAHKKHHKPIEGILPNLERRYRTTDSDAVRRRLEAYMTRELCTGCGGTRLKPHIRSCTIRKKSIVDVCAMTIEEAYGFFDSLTLKKTEREVAGEVVAEIRKRLHFMREVGLDYLTLERPVGTLSGGELQRIRLATQIGSGLSGVLYVLDEPTIGLHVRDNLRLIHMLEALRDLGNTVVVVEHDEQMIRAADHLIDLGPGAGVHGGEVLAEGSLDDVIQSGRSLTGRYLRNTKRERTRSEIRTGEGKISVIGACEHNLKHVTVDIPLGQLVCVTGVSGSGKSTLVDDILRKALFRKFHGSPERPGAHDRITGLERLNSAVVIDQSPVGRTPRSNPATYTGSFTGIRNLFAALPASKVRGFGPGRYSFNVKGGRCESCKGDGILRLEMHFLPDVYVTCEACRGKRYNAETLSVLYQGHSIADVLELTVDEACTFFQNIPVILRKLRALSEVGLGYLTLGQSATTLSGGEAQRVKLSAELGKAARGHTLYLLDEPTTGLHFADVQRLLGVLRRLRDAGNSVLMIEHNMDVICEADYLIDLGPEGGDGGGQIVAVGTPEGVAKCDASFTGRHLRGLLKDSG